jgi:hypothetical protein
MATNDYGTWNAPPLDDAGSLSGTPEGQSFMRYWNDEVQKSRQQGTAYNNGRGLNRQDLERAHQAVWDASGGQGYQPGQGGAVQQGGMAGGGMNYGGYAGGATDMSNIGLRGMGWAQGEAQRDRGATAIEDQELSDREAQARYGDQAGAIQLAREAAMGQAPSQAAYLMQAGLNQGLANQQAMAGGARGAAGIALAQGNAQANAATMQNQAYTQAGAMRADEMNQARNLYGGLAGTQRQQDQNRLGMGNDMSKYNAGANDQYRLGMGQLGLGYYGASQRPHESQLNADVGYYNTNVSDGNADADRQAQERARRAAQNQQRNQQAYQAIGQAFGMAGQIGAGVAGANTNSASATPPPAPRGMAGGYYQPSATGIGNF